MCSNIKMFFLFSATTTLVILTTTTIPTTYAQNEANILVYADDLQPTIRALNSAGIRFNLAAHDENNAGIFKRQTTSEELIPATSDLEEDVDGNAGVQQPQEPLGVIAPVAEVPTASEGEPSPRRITKEFSNSGL